MAPHRRVLQRRDERPGRLAVLTPDPPVDRPGDRLDTLLRTTPGLRLRQPDARSCGAACAVVAGLVLAPAAPAGVDPSSGWFVTAVLTRHQDLTSARDRRGRRQLPWPRVIGTPPWALARELTASTGVRHRTRVVRWSAPTPAVGVLYVGDRWLPRHVVLVVSEDPPRCYEPASGRVVAMDGKPLAGWRQAWLSVAPVR